MIGFFLINSPRWRGQKFKKTHTREDFFIDANFDSENLKFKKCLIQYGVYKRFSGTLIHIKN